MTVTVELYDTYKKSYTMQDWVLLECLIKRAKDMGYSIKRDDYAGYEFGWIVFDNEADAALFKLTYM